MIHVMLKKIILMYIHVTYLIYILYYIILIINKLAHKS